MRYGSVCSGIEAVTLAWEPLGFTPAFFAEVDPFCNAVLAHHWPSVPNLGDITREDFIEKAKERGPIDILVGGPPCQSFSSAGKRGGFSDPRGNLMLRFLDIAEALRPPFVLIENVHGLLSQDGGRAFGAILGKMEGCGFRRVAWRVLDAALAGVPQRRRRVFLVGYSGDHPLPDEVLAFAEGQGRDSQEGEEQGAEAARPSGRGPVPVTTEGEADRAIEEGEAVAFDWQAAGAGNDSSFRGGSRRYIVRKPGKTGALNACKTEAVVYKEKESGPHPFIVNAAFSCAKENHARPSETARCLDGTGGFATNQGGTVIVESMAFRERGREQGRTAEWQDDKMYALTCSGEGGRSDARQVAYKEVCVNVFGDNVVPSLVSRSSRGGAQPLSAGHNTDGHMVVQAVCGDHTHALTSEGGDASEDGTGRGTPIVAFHATQDPISGEVAPAMGCGNRQGCGTIGVAHRENSRLIVRRLTPRECERLMGVPDDFTLIPYKKRAIKKAHLKEILLYLKDTTGKSYSEEEARYLASDSVRYRAIGNSVAVPVLVQIGERLKMVGERGKC